MTTSRKNVSRDDLYAQVWSQPIALLADSFGVSGSYLARMCRDLNVPTPPRGYWAQLKAGKTPKKLTLPALRPGEPTTWIRDASSALTTDQRPQPPPPRAEIPIKHRYGPHGLLVTAEEVLSKSKDSYGSRHLSPRTRKLVDLLTTEEHREKTIHLAQKIFSRLEDYGYRVTIAGDQSGFHMTDLSDEVVPRDRSKDPYRTYPWRPSCCTISQVGTVAIGLSLIELLHELKEPGWYSSRRVGSGQYRLYAYSPYRHTELVRTWQDTKETPIASSLDAIVAQMEDMARQVPALIEEGERQAQLALEKKEAEEQEYRRKQTIEYQRQSEKESLETLRQTVARWAELRHQQQFLEELLRAAEEASPEIQEALAPKLEAARKLLSGPSAADILLAWKTPDERFADRPWWLKEPTD